MELITRKRKYTLINSRKLIIYPYHYFFPLYLEVCEKQYSLDRYEFFTAESSVKRKEAEGNLKPEIKKTKTKRKNINRWDKELFFLIRKGQSRK